jgi:hypothetical protein
MTAPTLRVASAEIPAREFVLQAGVNTFGRHASNHYTIDHPSVSGSHCEVAWDHDAVRVRDLGSTNGTFIDGQPTEQGVLRPGQTLRLGSVDLTLQTEAAAAPHAQVSPILRVEMPPLAPPLPHCAAAPAVRAVPIPITPPALPQGFFQRLPGAFLYPLSKNGLILLIAGTVVFALVEFLSGFFFILSIISTGYLFAYMQRIISVSAQGEAELPDYPEFSEWWSDIVSPFLLLAWTCLCCFAPAVLLWKWGDAQDPLVQAGALALLGAGGLYFPMALLAVAVTDNFLALNPLVVVPSIARIFVHYLAACVILGALLGLRLAGTALFEAVQVPVVSSVVLGFLSLYLLAVEMRILGLLYCVNRERLGWFS